MHVYFVRHGETLLNTKHVHQTPSTPLSERGRTEALVVAETLRLTSPDLLISSEYTRATQTARIIGSRVGLPLVTNNLFYEIVRPSSLFEKSVFRPETFLYVILSVFKRKDPTWRYADAENYTDISNRAQRSLTYLESLNGEHESIIVVSHTVFINVMVAYMCRNRILDVRDLLLTFLHIKRMKNCDVIHVEYVGSKTPNTCRWRVVHDTPA